MRRLALTTGLVIGYIATALAGVAQAETVLADVSRATLVNAYSGVVAWSTYDQALGKYRLTVYRKGRVSTPPVPPSDSVFDADLGPDAKGKVTIVYSRCTQRVEQLPFGGGSAPVGCDLYRFAIGAKRETKIKRLSKPRTSEFLPSIWGRQIAFARTQTDSSGGSCVSPVWIGNVATGRQRRLASGSLGDYQTAPPCAWRTAPTSVDLRGQRVAFGWYYAPHACGGVQINRPADDADASELWVASPGSKARVLEGRCGGNRFNPVSLTPSSVFDSSFGSVVNPQTDYFAPSLRRFDFKSRRYYEAPQPATDNFGVSDGKQVYVLRLTGDTAAPQYKIVAKPLAGFERSQRDPGDAN